METVPLVTGTIPFCFRCISTHCCWSHTFSLVWLLVQPQMQQVPNLVKYLLKNKAVFAKLKAIYFRKNHCWQLVTTVSHWDKLAYYYFSYLTRSYIHSHFYSSNPRIRWIVLFSFKFIKGLQVFFMWNPLICEHQSTTDAPYVTVATAILLKEMQWYRCSL